MTSPIPASLISLEDCKLKRRVIFKLTGDECYIAYGSTGD